MTILSKTLLLSLMIVASTASFAKVLAQPGSTQIVTIMNALANPDVVDATSSPIQVKYYDGKGTNPPCWIENSINYHADPVVAGAGGRNGCGVGGAWPPAIVKVDIISLKSNGGQKMYNDVLGYAIKPNRFYTNLIIMEDVAPVFTADGKLVTPGTIKIKKTDEGE